MKRNLAYKQPAIEQNNGYGLRGCPVIWNDVPGKGRGVFATQPIKKGEIIEVAPVVPVSKKHVPDGAPPDMYVLDWDEDVKGKEYAMALGYIMLYNHSPDANMELESDLEALTVTAVALRNIKAGEELTWDYGCELWFEAAE